MAETDRIGYDKYLTIYLGIKRKYQMKTRCLVIPQVYLKPFNKKQVMNDSPPVYF
jgi:hypothetical protein